MWVSRWQQRKKRILINRTAPCPRNLKSHSFRGSVLYFILKGLIQTEKFFNISLKATQKITNKIKKIPWKNFIYSCQKLVVDIHLARLDTNYIGFKKYGVTSQNSGAYNPWRQKQRDELRDTRPQSQRKRNILALHSKPFLAFQMGGRGFLPFISRNICETTEIAPSQMLAFPQTADQKRTEL